MVKNLKYMLGIKNAIAKEIYGLFVISLTIAKSWWRKRDSYFEKQKIAFIVWVDGCSQLNIKI